MTLLVDASAPSPSPSQAVSPLANDLPQQNSGLGSDQIMLLCSVGVAAAGLISYGIYRQMKKAKKIPKDPQTLPPRDNSSMKSIAEDQNHSREPQHYTSSRE